MEYNITKEKLDEYFRDLKPEKLDHIFPIGEGAQKAIDEAIKKELESFDVVEDRNKITGIGNQELLDQYNPWKEYNNSMESYVQLMDTFLNRRDKRKLSRYKGFKSFTDRIYGR